MTGALDGAFGQDLTGDSIPDGMLLTNILRAGAAGSSDTAMAVTTLANGKVLVAGQSLLGATGIASGLVVARYLVNGELDHSFGQDLDNDGQRDGIAHILPGGSASGILGAADLVVLPDGSILLVGTALGDGVNVPASASDQNFALVHLTSDGQLDTSFGAGGIVTTDFTPGTPGIDQALSVAIDHANRILVGGIGADNDAALARYSLDGQLDASFGQGGKVLLSLGGKSQVEEVLASPDGKVVALIERDSDFGVVRLNENGTRDSTFGVDSSGDGVPDGANFFSFTPPLTNDMLLDAGGAALLGDGSVIVAGTAGNIFAGLQDNMFVARISSEGIADTSFGQDLLGDGTLDGLTIVDFGGPSQGRAVVVQVDGGIIVGGQANEGNGNRSALARLDSSGSLDPFFGSGNGKVLLDFGAPANPGGVFDLAIDSQRRLLVAGVATTHDAKDFAVARLFTEIASPNQDSDGDGVIDTIENGIDDSGDGNGDGIPDRLQGSVASLPDALGNYITLEVNGPDGPTLTNISVALPDGVDNLIAPMGVVSYDVVGLGVGAHAMVTMHLQLSADANAFVKFAGQPGQPQPHWFVMNVTAEIREGGELFDDDGDGLIDRVVMEMTDGGAGDEDGATDGAVRITGGPALLDGDVPGIGGDVRLDADFDGIADATEQGLAGWVAFLDLNGNGVLDNPVSGNGTADLNATEPFSVTDAAGHYAIGGLNFGGHALTLQLQPGFTVLAAAGGNVRQVTLTAAGPEAVEDFAVRDLDSIGGGGGSVSDAPHASISGPSSADEGSVITLSAAGSTHPNQPLSQLQFAWDLDGDGDYDDANGVSPTVRVSKTSATASRTFGVRVTDTEGDSDTATKSITVRNISPSADAGGPYSAYETNPITLNALHKTTHPTEGLSTLIFEWDYDGDGQYDDAIGGTPDYTPPAVVKGTKLFIYLRVTDSDGDTSFDFAEVNIGNAGPIADAGGPYTVSEGATETLTALGSTHPTQAVHTLTFEWDLDNDGQFDDATGATYNFVAPFVSSNTTSTIRVRVTDSDGDSSTDPATITVVNRVPTAHAGGPYLVSEGSSIALDARASSHPTQAANTLDYAWDFDNDGQFDDAFGDTPVFTAPLVNGDTGVPLYVRVTDSDGDMDVAFGFLTIRNEFFSAPTVDAGGPYNVGESSSVALAASGVVNPSLPPGPLTFTWDLDGDGVFGETGPGAANGNEVGATPTFFAANHDGPSEVTVYLRGTDEAGNQAGDTAIVHVFNRPPVPDAGGPYVVNQGLGVTLHGSATDPFPGDPLTLTWDLDGDGIFGETGGNAARGNETGANPTFDSTGLAIGQSVTVALRAADDDGGAATDTATVTVQGIIVGGRVIAFAASDFEKVFGMLDLATGNFNTIGVIEDSQGFLFDDVEALAADPATGIIYSISRGNQLIRIDIATGIATLIGNPGLNDVDAMAFNPLTGELFASDSTAATRPGVLYRIDVNTGAATLVTQMVNPDPDGLIPLNPVDPKIDGMAFHPVTGQLFGAYSSSGSPSFTVTINLATGKLSNVGPANVGDIEDIAFTPDGRLFGVIGEDGFLGPVDPGVLFEGLVEIDTMTGNASVVGAFPASPFGGLWDMEGLAILSIATGQGGEVLAGVTAEPAAPAVAAVTAALGPITASIAAADVTLTGHDALRVSVTYSAADGIDLATLGDRDIRIVGNKLKQYAKLVESVDNGDGSVTATYEVTAPRKGWTASHAGSLRVDVVGRGVRDALGQTFRRTQALTSFDLNVTTTVQFGPYALTLTATGKLEGTLPLRFTATVSGPLVHASWLEALEARVAGPGGKSPLTLVETQQLDATTVQATFELAAPAGGWTDADLGVYKLEVRGAGSTILSLFNRFAPLAGVVVGA